MRMLAFVIFGVGVVTAALIWGSLHLIRGADKMQRNPRLLRWHLLLLGTLYVLSSGWGIIQVATGNYPPETLIGIAVAASMAWLLIKQASNVKSGQ